MSSDFFEQENRELGKKATPDQGTLIAFKEKHITIICRREI